MALHVLRKVPHDLIVELHHPEIDPNFNHLYLDARKPWFNQDYLCDEFPRASDITKDIVAATEGFALWEDDAGLVATYPSSQAAEAAKASARLVPQVMVELPDAVESGTVSV